MANLTGEQIKKLNVNLKNGFKFDCFAFWTHNEKNCRKQIDLGEKRVLAVSLFWRNTRDFKVVPCLNLNIAEDRGAVMVSHGLGFFYNMGDTVDRKNYKVLEALTATLDDARCLAIYEELKATQVNQMAY